MMFLNTWFAASSTHSLERKFSRSSMRQLSPGAASLSSLKLRYFSRKIPGSARRNW